MTAELSMDNKVALSLAILRASALRSAIVLRDCSFRARSGVEERRACRTLMREEAVNWRRSNASPSQRPPVARSAWSK